MNQVFCIYSTWALADVYMLACPSPWQAPGYSESVGDTLPMPPKSRLCLGLRATLCSDLSVWISFFHFQRDCCPYFQVLRPPSFCPQSLPISFLSDSLNISRKSSSWEKWGGGVVKPLMNKGHPQSHSAGELSIQSTRTLDFSHFWNSVLAGRWGSYRCVYWGGGKKEASRSSQEKSCAHQERSLCTAA